MVSKKMRKSRKSRKSRKMKGGSKFCYNDDPAVLSNPYGKPVYASTFNTCLTIPGTRKKRIFECGSNIPTSQNITTVCTEETKYGGKRKNNKTRKTKK